MAVFQLKGVGHWSALFCGYQWPLETRPAQKSASGNDYFRNQVAIFYIEAV
jgi:hypothetical protein